MSNQVQFSAFNFKSSAVRVIVDPNQEPWFCGTDVCAILGYANAPDAMKKHCKETGIAKRYISYPSGRKEAIFINEPNLYRLIIKSRKPEAEPFEAWVFEEVLPQIRKTGQYSQNTQPNLPLVEPEKCYTAELTEHEINQLAWLLFSHKQMNDLLGDLLKPLEAIGSRYSAMVYSHHYEYKNHYNACLKCIKRMIEPFKHNQDIGWTRVNRHLNKPNF